MTGCVWITHRWRRNAVATQCDVRESIILTSATISLRHRISIAKLSSPPKGYYGLFMLPGTADENGSRKVAHISGSRSKRDPDLKTSLSCHGLFFAVQTTTTTTSTRIFGFLFGTVGHKLPSKQTHGTRQHKTQKLDRAGAHKQASQQTSKQANKQTSTPRTTRSMNNMIRTALLFTVAARATTAFAPVQTTKVSCWNDAFLDSLLIALVCSLVRSVHSFAGGSVCIEIELIVSCPFFVFMSCRYCRTPKIHTHAHASVFFIYRTRSRRSDHCSFVLRRLWPPVLVQMRKGT